jgi:zinc/manganese transport system substrate-binding protein
MKPRLLLPLLLLPFAASAPAGTVRVATAYPYAADLVRIIGGNRVDVRSLSDGNWDPHTVIPRPSLIARLRTADLLVINGAGLEIGWLPPLLNQANNPSVQTGTSGLLDLSRFVSLRDVPASVSRAGGDVHPEGNPHFSLDPENILPLAEAIADRLSEIDPAGAGAYRAALGAFRASWSRKLDEWSAAMKPLAGVRVFEYHGIFDYFLLRYGLVIAGTVEPLPGIPPSPRRVGELARLDADGSVRFILQDVYHPSDASERLSAMCGARMIVLPHDAGAVPETGTVEAMFDEIVRRLTHD